MRVVVIFTSSSEQENNLQQRAPIYTADTGPALSVVTVVILIFTH